MKKSKFTDEDSAGAGRWREDSEVVRPASDQCLTALNAAVEDSRVAAVASIGISPPL